MRLFLVMVLAVWMVLPHGSRAENEKQIIELESALTRIQQDAQATYQQFLMIQELRRNEMLNSPSSEFPDTNVESTPIPKYEAMMQRREIRKDRIEKYTTDLDQLYTRFRALEKERQTIVEQINQLKQKQGN